MRSRQRQVERRATRVCLVSPLPPPYGGIARWTALVIGHASAEQRIRLSVVNTAVRLRSMHSRSPGVRALAGGIEAIGIAARLARSIVADRPNVIHINTSGDMGVIRDLVLLRMAQVARIASVYHIRFGRLPLIADQDTWEWKAIRRALRMANTIICLDAATLETVQERLPWADPVLIPNCVDLSTIPERSGDTRERTVLFVGWVLPEKGVPELVEAWSRANTPGWRLDIVGPFERPYVDELARLSAPSAAPSFLGPLPHAEVLQRIADCDVFVLPSHTEGFPNVVVEAMAMSRPVVSTPVGALPDMLANGAGVLVPVNHPAELASALSRLIADDGARDRLGRAAVQRARTDYSLDRVYPRYEQVWNDVASQDRGW